MQREDQPTMSTVPSQVGSESAQELLRRRMQSRGMSGARKPARNKCQRPLQAREQISLLLNPGRFLKAGLRTASRRPEMRDIMRTDGRAPSLCRVDGRSVGVVAYNPLVRGGASDADACAKAASFMVLCDSFNLPLLFFVDQPGFMIGADGERRGVIGKVMNWMNALSLATVPKISVIMRKSCGQAVLNMGGGGNSDHVVCWNTAEVNFTDPRSAVAIVRGLRPDDEGHAEALQEMTRGTSAYDMAAGYHAHDVILPGETRATLVRLLDIHALRLSNGVGEQRMRTWPTSYL